MMARLLTGDTGNYDPKLISGVLITRNLLFAKGIIHGATFLKVTHSYSLSSPHWLDRFGILKKG